MARPPKEGLDYFPHDTDASNDEKIEALRSIHGNNGYAFYFILLERIYRTPNFELDISASEIGEEMKQILARKIAVTVQEFDLLLETALRWGCFDKQKYSEKGILSSNGIRRRASAVLEKREKMRNLYRLKVSAAETREETPQSKVKKSKVNNNPPLPPHSGGMAVKENCEQRKQINIQQERFAAFWTAYPKKRNKGQAEKAFEKVAPDEQLMEAILTSIERAKKSAQWLKEKGQYIPYPATWLNAKGWEDEINDLKPKAMQIPELPLL